LKNATDFSPGDFVVYPGHGLGKVTGLETKTVSGEVGEWFVITFDHDRMTLRLPAGKARTSGLRGLSSRSLMDKALVTLQGNASRKKVMWSRRALEYAAKIKSGDPISIAEVVRDLHRADDEPQGSYSERMLYEQARDRLTREVAAIEGIDLDAATTKLGGLLKAA
jgi:CarD family transcriptional regulator